MRLNRLLLCSTLGAVLGLGAMVVTPRSSAAVIALYPFDSISTGASASTDAETNSTASSIVAGAGVTMVSSGTGNPAPSGAMQGATTTSEAAAFAGFDYFEFTISPEAGFEMDLTSLSLQYQRNNLSAPTNLFIRSSIDAFSANLFSDGTLSASSFETGMLSLSSLSVFQDLTAPVTFRIYAWGGSSGTSLRFDNITLEGSLNPVPEPSTYCTLLLGIGALVWVGRIRRARISQGYRAE